MDALPVEASVAVVAVADLAAEAEAGVEVGVRVEAGVEAEAVLLGQMRPWKLEVERKR